MLQKISEMVMRRLPIAILLAAAVTVSAFAQDAGPRFLIQETGRAYDSLTDAVTAVGNGRATILIAPGTYRECAVQNAGQVRFTAREPGTVILDGQACEGKAALVLRGRSAEVDGIIFQNLRVPDGNGAGIRLERGDLTVTRSLFRNSEEGILTHDDPRATVRIDQSTFQHLGRCDRDLDCAHSVYVGNYGALIVTRTRFELGSGGHYLKSRAARVDITGNSFDDSRGRLTNYMIDLSNGAQGRITGNEMVQGRDKENYTAFITIAPEGRSRDSSGLVVSGNSAAFVPGLKRDSSFVANCTDDSIAMGPNRLAQGIKLTDQR
jgi:hypothetical protein